MADVRVLDADLIESCATAVTRAHDELWWILHPLEFGAGAVPWQGGTQAQWDDIRRRINNELGYMDADAQYLRRRAEWTRNEQLKLELPVMAGLLSALFPNEPSAPPIPTDPLAPVESIAPQSPKGKPAPAASQGSGLFAAIADSAAATVATTALIAKFASTYSGKNQVDDGKGNYPGQCVSLVKRYTREVFGKDLGALGGGGPKPEWASPQAFKPGQWDQIQKADLVSRGGYKAGDIIFFAGGGWNPTFGHIGIVESVSSDGKTIVVLDQRAGRKPAEVAPTTYGINDKVMSDTVLGVMRNRIAK